MKWIELASQFFLSSYYISKSGSIYDILNKKEILPYINKEGYLIVDLCNDDNEYNSYYVANLLLGSIHRIPNEDVTLVYLDNNKLNIKRSNLMWSDEEYFFTLESNETIKVSYIPDEVWTLFPKHMSLSKYAVSSMGRLINIKMNRLLFGTKNLETNYVHVRVSDNNNKDHNYGIHQLVLEAFIPKPNEDDTTDHINRIRDDNVLTNLRWANASEQNKNKAPHYLTGKPVYQLDFENNKINYFISIADAARHMKTFYKCISEACNNKRNSAVGFKWRYASEVDVNNFGNWKYITREGCEGIQVSDKGYIKYANGKVTNGHKGKQYKYFSNNNHKTVSIDIVVAEEFIGPIPEGYVVTHMNRDKYDNEYTAEHPNLQITTNKENAIHTFKLGLNSKAKPVERITLCNNKVKIYYSTSEAARQTLVGK